MKKLTAVDSAITSETVAISGKSFSELRSIDNRLFVNCRDPANKGKSCVLELLHDNVGGTKVVTSLDSNVRSAVHEYGGGSYLPISVSNNDTNKQQVMILFTEYTSGHKLFVLPLLDNNEEEEEETNKNTLVPIDTPQACRFADFSHDMKRCRAICIMEDHSNPHPDKVINCVVSISLSPLLLHPSTSTTSLIVVAKGNDFYSTPTLSPNGQHVAYTTWNHPSMPWYTTRICIQKLDQVTGEPVDGSCVTVPSSSSSSSMLEPRWCTNDKLVYLSDETNWYNFYSWDRTSTNSEDENNNNAPTCLWKKDAEFSDSSQGWILGLSPYVVLPDGRLVAQYSSATEGSILVLLHTNEKDAVQEITRQYLPPSPFYMSTFCVCSDDKTNIALHFLGGSPTDPVAIWKLNMLQNEKAIKILSSVDSSQLNVGALHKFFSIPQKVEFPNKRGSLSYAYLYLPNNLLLPSSSESSNKPPLLVKVHGGPTSCTSPVFRLAIQYWASRGFAVLDVDYGGSAGYGRNYRLSLNGQWGIADVDDVCSGAEWCVEKGLVDANAICIDGGSAGGYTTLASLTFRDTFKVGASLYGVSDLSALAKETHKFESKYLDTLVGFYPSHIYEERSPINFTDLLNCPVILLQGDEDKIVPPNQAETMYDALTNKHIPTTLVLYRGEQHGFRMSYNIRHALNSEYSFFCKILGYEVQIEDGIDDIKVGERLEV